MPILKLLSVYDSKTALPFGFVSLHTARIDTHSPCKRTLFSPGALRKLAVTVVLSPKQHHSNSLPPAADSTRCLSIVCVLFTFCSRSIGGSIRRFCVLTILGYASARYMTLFPPPPGIWINRAPTILQAGRLYAR